MAKDSAIEWCDASCSPWRGCNPVSAGCLNCYAERRAKRVGEDFGTIVRSKTTFDDPLKWKKPLTIFVGHLSDFFHADVPEEWRREFWEIMRRTPRHTYLLLTKRPENIADMLPERWLEDLREHWMHIWLGITAENQETYDERLPHLMMNPAAGRFISFEPLLGSIDMRIRDTLSQGWGPDYETIGDLIDGVIVGGESGPNRRKMEPSWVMRIQNDCAWKDIPFFFKQWGGTKKVNGTWGGRQYMGYFWDDLPWDDRPE